MAGYQGDAVAAMQRRMIDAVAIDSRRGGGGIDRIRCRYHGSG